MLFFIITQFIEFYSGKTFCKLDEHLELPSKWKIALTDLNQINIFQLFICHSNM